MPVRSKRYCIEALMQDGKALQSGTSHFLGQNFAQIFRREVRQQREPARICLGDQLGRFDAADGRADHGPLGRQRPRSAAKTRADPGRHHSDLQDAGRSREDQRKGQSDLRRIEGRGHFGQSTTTATTSVPAGSLPSMSCAACRSVSASGMRDLENGTIEVARRDTLTKESVVDRRRRRIRQRAARRDPGGTSIKRH